MCHSSPRPSFFLFGRYQESVSPQDSCAHRVREYLELRLHSIVLLRFFNRLSFTSHLLACFRSGLSSVVERSKSRQDTVSRLQRLATLQGIGSATVRIDDGLDPCVLWQGIARFEVQ